MPLVPVRLGGRLGPQGLTVDRRALLATAWALGATRTVAAAARDNALSVLWMFSTGEQRDLWVRLVGEFAQQFEGPRPSSRELDQATYKEEFEKHLRAQPTADVMLWFAGHRLAEWVEAGLIEPLDDVAREGQWAESFLPAALDAVRVRGRVYALPLSTYQWGFYYRRSVFERLGLSPPVDWEGWLKLNDQLRAAGLAPIGLGAADLWPLGGWFDYFNLRLHGRAFHLDLLAGRQSWLDPRVAATLSRWAQLMERGDFQAGASARDWRQALPYVSRGLTGTILMGNFAALQFPPAVRRDLGYFPFPTLDARQPPAEVAPLDVLIVPRHARNPKRAMQFLRFAAQARVQTQINQAMGMIPPHRGAQLGASPLIQAGAQVLAQAAGGSTQYFDRDAPGAFSNPALAVLRDFHERRLTVSQTQQRLEALRRSPTMNP
ncbi:ABC transporter substrate-binding protein [Inhella gelatinilytica]|uniref:Carbohydrate ABC transporter substrate-binding protein n=1 Tax=Inhella gelatinilytica TaxID=2795030 RepID=A0A931IV55_9BURK|nr:ABC transporter substrate-binding protein [Inhella gelatinilytica]MBH9551580.1 carbohydrate ABC transporter substrate-binding protein [Inhella gelatinilytica]